MKRSSYRGEHKGSTAKARFKIAADRTFRGVLSVVLAIGLMPGLSFAGDTGQDGESISAPNPDDATEQVVPQDDAVQTPAQAPVPAQAVSTAAAQPSASMKAMDEDELSVSDLSVRGTQQAGEAVQVEVSITVPANSGPYKVEFSSDYTAAGNAVVSVPEGFTIASSDSEVQRTFSFTFPKGDVYTASSEGAKVTVTPVSDEDPDPDPAPTPVVKTYNTSIDTRAPMTLSGPTVANGVLATDASDVYYSKDKEHALTATWTVGNIPSGAEAITRESLGTEPTGVTWSVGELDAEHGTQTITATFSTTDDTYDYASTAFAPTVTDVVKGALINTEGKTFGYKVVRDTAAPTISKVEFDKTPSDSSVDNALYYNLSNSSDTLKLTVEATDATNGSGIDIADDKSYVLVEGLTGLENDGKTALSSEGKATVVIPRSSFVDGSALKTGTAKIVVFDKAGNKATYNVVKEDTGIKAEPVPDPADGGAPTQVSFTAENAWMEAVTEVGHDGDSEAKTIDEKTYFGSATGMKLTVSDTSAVNDADGVTATSKEGSGEAASADVTKSGADGSVVFAVAKAAADATDVTAVQQVATMMSPHNAMVEFSRDFIIDPTTPEATIALSTAHATQSMGEDGEAYTRNVYNADTPVEATVTIANAATVAESGITVKVNSTNVPVSTTEPADGVTVTRDADAGTYTIKIKNTDDKPWFADATEYQVTATATNAFDKAPEHEEASSKFILDTSKPVITLAFTGPVEKVTIENKIRAFFGKETVDEVDKVGGVIVTASDPTMGTDSTKLTVETSSDGSTWNTVDATVETDAVDGKPALKATINLDSLGEGDWQLRATATDLAGNEGAYTYATNDADHDPAADATTIDGEAVSDLDTTFTVDTTSPVIEATEVAGTKAFEQTEASEKWDVYADSATLTFTVKDRAFDPNSSTIVIEGVTDTSKQFKLQDNKWDVSADGAQVWVKGDSDANGIITWTANYPLTDDGIYAVHITANDYAKNATSTDSFKVEVDAAKPNVTVQFKDNERAVASGGVDYFKASTAVVATVTVVDRNFNKNTDASTLTITTGEGYSSTNVNIGDWTPGEDADTWTRTITFADPNPAGTKYSFTGVLKDNASHVISYTYGMKADGEEGKGGNVSTLDKANSAMTENGAIVIDSDLPSVAVTFNKTAESPRPEGADENIDYFKDELVATITVTDANFKKEETGAVTVTGSGSSVEQDWTQDASDKSTWTYKINFPENATGETYSFNFDAVDFVGNKTRYEYGFNKEATADQGKTSTVDGDGSGAKLERTSFAIDCSDPNVYVAMDGKRVFADDTEKIDGFNVNTVKVTVDDASFDAKATGNPVFTSPSSPADITFGEWSSGVMTITLPDSKLDESYVFGLTAKDLFGNESLYTYGDNKENTDDHPYVATTKDVDGATMTEDGSFVIDTKGPELSVSFETTPVRTTGKETDITRYYNATHTEVVAKVTVRDVHPSEGLIGIQVLDDAGSVVTEDVEISEHPTITTTSDNYVYEYTVTITNPEKDSTYKLHVTGTDEFENQIRNADANTYVKAASGSADAYYESVVKFDVTSPTVHVTWGDVATNGKYYNADRAASIAIDDDNFDASLITFSRDGGKTWNTASAASWTENFADNGTFQLQVKGSDLADNPLVVAAGSSADDGAPADSQVGSVNGGVYSSAEFVIDKNAPVITITADQAVSRPVGGIDYYNAADELTITVKVKDEGGNFDPLNDKSGNETKVTTTGKKGAETNWANGSYVLTFTEYGSQDEASGIDVVAYDLAGNRATLSYADASVNKSQKFVLDRTAPQIIPVSGTNIPSNMPSNGFQDTSNGNYVFYNNQTTLNIRLYDALGIQGYSLLGGDDAYKIDKTTAPGGATSFDVPITLQDGHEFGKAFTLNVIDNAGNWRNWEINPATGEVKVGDTSLNSANTPLYNTDALRLLYPLALVQDTEAPSVRLSGVTAGQFYNSSQNVRLDITELNFRYIASYNGGQVVLSTTATPGGNGSPSAASIPARETIAANAATGEYYYNLPFNVDGHYTVHAQVTDPAGNSRSADIGEFTIDTKAPEATISWDNNNAQNGMYYNASRTATITVVEHNFQASDFSVETTGAVGGWTDGGNDTHTCVVSFTTDGRYTLSVSGHDRAGNAMNTVTEPEFVIDLTAPTIDFSNVTAQTAYNGEIAPVINYHDEANFDTNGMTWTLTGNKHGAQTFSASQGSSGNDGTVSFNDFPREVEADDIYTLQAHLTDMAGNQADNSITFSVNRFGSNFIIMDAQAFTEHKGYLSESREILVQEINVSGAQSEQHGVSVTHGLSTENLTRASSGTPTSKGFYIDSSSDTAGWSTYMYHVGSGNFDDDGNYHVVISSTDTATNLNNSASYYDPDEHAVADAEVSFILDTADPIIDGISVSDGEIADAGAKALSFTVTDNIDIDEVKVVVDGEEQTVVPELGGLCTVDLPAKAFAPRDMQIVATDLAGRSAEAQVLGFHWTDNFIELHLPFVIGGVIVVAAAAVGGVLFVRRRNG